MDSLMEQKRENEASQAVAFKTRSGPGAGANAQRHAWASAHQ